MKIQNLIIISILCLVSYMIFSSLWAPVLVAFFGGLKAIDAPVDPADYFEEE